MTRVRGCTNTRLRDAIRCTPSISLSPSRKPAAGTDVGEEKRYFFWQSRSIPSFFLPAFSHLPAFSCRARREGATRCDIRSSSRERCWRLGVDCRQKRKTKNQKARNKKRNGQKLSKGALRKARRNSSLYRHTLAAHHYGDKRSQTTTQQ